MGLPYTFKSAKLERNGKEFVFQGYYSENDGRWYVVLPASYGESELYLEAKTSEFCDITQSSVAVVQINDGGKSDKSE